MFNSRFNFCEVKHDWKIGENLVGMYLMTQAMSNYVSVSQVDWFVLLMKCLSIVYAAKHSADIKLTSSVTADKLGHRQTSVLDFDDESLAEYMGQLSHTHTASQVSSVLIINNENKIGFV